MYLVEVKKPTESKAPWDYFKVRATIPADEAFRPLSEGGCPLVKGNQFRQRWMAPLDSRLLGVGYPRW
jgi:hypothetical protein